MYAERLILETDVDGKLKQVPLLPANKQLEAIFLVIAENSPMNSCRQPHPDIAGKTRIIGNIIDAVPESEWNLPNRHGASVAPEYESTCASRLLHPIPPPQAGNPHPIPLPEGEGSFALSPSGGKMDRGLGANESLCEFHVK